MVKMTNFAAYNSGKVENAHLLSLFSKNTNVPYLMLVHICIYS